MRRVGEVAAVRAGLPSFGLDELDRVAGVVVFLQVGDGDIGALLGEGDRDRATDTRVAARDEGGLAGQQIAAAIVAHLVPGAFAHLVGLTGVGDRLRFVLGVLVAHDRDGAR